MQFVAMAIFTKFSSKTVGINNIFQFKNNQFHY